VVVENGLISFLELFRVLLRLSRFKNSESLFIIHSERSEAIFSSSHLLHFFPSISLPLCLLRRNGMKTDPWFKLYSSAEFSGYKHRHPMVTYSSFFYIQCKPTVSLFGDKLEIIPLFHTIQTYCYEMLY